MIKFNKPNQLNGTQLIAELKAIGVIVNEKTSPLLDGNGEFWLDIPAKDETKAKPIVDAHNGTTVAPDKSAQRQVILDRLGLTSDEARLLLGS
jgi:hypothetical protein